MFTKCHDTNDTNNIEVDKGKKIVEQNCSGCHSYKSDTTYSTITLMDINNLGDSAVLQTRISAIAKDTNHQNNIPHLSHVEIQSISRYIKFRYNKKY